MDAVEIGPVPPERRTQSAFDLFLIFAGANIVATTLQTGASLAPAAASPIALASLLVAGVLGGSLLVAILAALGPRLGVPSVIAARAALGRRGAALVALLLYGTNFAWIAVNNVIAASACAAVWGGRGSERVWSGALGLLATAIVAGGKLAMWCVVGVGLFTSIGWSNTFSLAIEGVGIYKSQASSLLVMAILGGAVLPPIQGRVADLTHNLQFSFIVPLIAYAYVAFYGWKGHRVGRGSLTA